MYSPVMGTFPDRFDFIRGVLRVSQARFFAVSSVFLVEIPRFPGISGVFPVNSASPRVQRAKFKLEWARKVNGGGRLLAGKSALGGLLYGVLAK